MTAASRRGLGRRRPRPRRAFGRCRAARAPSSPSPFSTPAGPLGTRQARAQQGWHASSELSQVCTLGHSGCGVGRSRRGAGFRGLGSQWGRRRVPRETAGLSASPRPPTDHHTHTLPSSSSAMLRSIARRLETPRRAAGLAKRSIIVTPNPLRATASDTVRPSLQAPLSSARASSSARCSFLSNGLFRRSARNESALADDSPAPSAPLQGKWRNIGERYPIIDHVSPRARRPHCRRPPSHMPS